MRISSFLCEEKLKLTMRTFIQSQFNNCPLIWMFHSRVLNHKINSLHERALRVVYKNDNLTFAELLDKDGSFTIHDRNLQKLALEMYKVKHKISPSPVCEIFTPSPLETKDWVIPNARTVKNGLETIRYRGPKTWDLVPFEIRNSNSLAIFKSRIKNWKPVGCTCRLCKTYVFGVGFV